MSAEILQLTDEVNAWLKDPISSRRDTAMDKSEHLLSVLHLKLEQNPELGKTLGPLIGRVKGMQNRLKNIDSVNWVSVGNGGLAIGHRPGSKLISDIRLQSGTHILTLLSESEGAREVEKQTKKEGMHWLWFGMSSATPPHTNRLAEATSLFTKMADALNQKAKIYVHCSAGIHRTGMITYALLRYLGLAEMHAKNILSQLRGVTSESVGEERLAWGEQFVRTKQLPKNDDEKAT